LWVNLPAKDKMADAGYQTLRQTERCFLVMYSVRAAFRKAPEAEMTRWPGCRESGRPRCRQPETHKSGIRRTQPGRMGRIEGSKVHGRPNLGGLGIIR